MLLGNQPIQRYLEKIVQEGMIPSTLLFSGPRGVGKGLFARHFAKKILASPLDHPADLSLLEPEGKSGLYSIESIREMIDKSHQAPFEGERKLFILEEAHRMQPAAANALLKTLEEPPLGSHFLLVTSSAQELLPTILSRAIHLRFLPLSEGEVSQFLVARGYPPEVAQRGAKRGEGSLGKALKLLSDPVYAKIEEALLRFLQGGVNGAALDKIFEEEKEVSPLRVQEMGEYLFSLLLSLGRDQVAREIAPECGQLFCEGSSSLSFASLEAWEERVAKARLGWERNLKLSVSLHSLI